MLFLTAQPSGTLSLHPERRRSERPAVSFSRLHDDGNHPHRFTHNLTVVPSSAVGSSARDATIIGLLAKIFLTIGAHYGSVQAERTSERSERSERASGATTSGESKKVLYRVVRVQSSESIVQAGFCNPEVWFFRIESETENWFFFLIQLEHRHINNRKQPLPCGTKKKGT